MNAPRRLCKLEHIGKSEPAQRWVKKYAERGENTRKREKQKRETNRFQFEFGGEGAVAEARLIDKELRHLTHDGDALRRVVDTCRVHGQTGVRIE